MKKVFVIASVGMLMFATSCKKSYTCTCTDTFYNQEYTKIGKTTAALAKTSCEFTSGCTWSKK
jgi:hypothetical protein|tara:strand:+ start:31127 stop:31315 length:189 start_codon:yes stop_codon:yes gene_type:complete